jgi:hypothetical protein
MGGRSMTSVTIRNKINGETFRVVADIQMTDKLGLSMKSDADISGVIPLKTDPNGNNPIRRRNAIEAECISGAAYASRLFKNDRFSIKVLSVAGPYGIREEPGFAVATRCAIASALGRDPVLPARDSGNWELIEATTKP